MGTRVGRGVHGEEEEKGGRARREASWPVMKIFPVLHAARDTFFLAPIAGSTTEGTALGSYERYCAYGVTFHLFYVEKAFFHIFTRFAARSSA